MGLLGMPFGPPRAIVNRALSDVGALVRAARLAPAQLDRALDLGQEIASIGREGLRIAGRIDQRAQAIMALGERIDQRAEAIMELGERIDRRAEAIMELGDRIDQRGIDLIALGERMSEAGERVDSRGAEIVERANTVVETGTELIGVLPALERAVAMATPLEGAIDRFGRLVDRLPGGVPRRRTLPDPEAVDEPLALDDSEPADELAAGVPDAESPEDVRAAGPGGVPADEPRG